MSIAEPPDVAPVSSIAPGVRGARWSTLDSAEAVADALIDVYEERGFATYDEVVSQTDHALQCGASAMAAHAPVATIVAAFLHDLGHLLVATDVSVAPSTPTAQRNRGRDTQPQDFHHHHHHHHDHRHEVIGADFLAAWFGDSVTEPIRLHVAAKRYLCAADPGYHATLSPASIRSLELQGGPMSPDEAESFTALPAAVSAVELRLWDELAKEVGAPVPSLDTFRTLVESVVATVPIRPDEPAVRAR